MLETHHKLALLATLALLGAPGRAEAAPWDVRYAQHADQTPEWTAAGYVPAWRVTWSDTARPEVRWQDDERGTYRGWLLIARPLAATDPPPAAVAVSFDYVTHCDLDDPARLRSGEVHAFVMSAEAWRSLATQPAAAKLLDTANMPGLLLFARVHGQGADVHEWTPSARIELPAPLRGMPAGQELWVGVAWGAYHFDSVEWGGFRNFEVTMESAKDVQMRFWRALDLERADLSAVRRAVAAGDEAGATAAFAAHLRGRERPVVANPIPPGDAQTIARADEVLKGTYQLVGCPPYTFPGEIVWNADPFNYEQWAISLNRHGHWPTLAAAYLASRDERYAAEWRKQLDSWVAAMPVFIGRRWIQGPYNQLGKAPLSLDAGIRTGQTWFPAFEVFRKSPSVGDETLVRFVRSCWEHALYLMREENFKRGSNWGAMECNGLYHIGVMLPEFKQAPVWRDTALQRVTGELDGQVYPDGAQVELAPGYHGVSLGNFLGILNLAKANDETLPEGFAGRLERMFDYYLKIAMPDLRMPALNDSGRGSIQGYFRDAVKLFPEREEFRWALTSRQDGKPPEYLSLAMPYAGWVIMRTGWGSDASYLLFDAGPFGAAHQHEDKLSVILYAHGRELVSDAGNYAYDESQWRRYVLSTRAHSTIRVDGQDQSSRNDRSEYRALTPDTHGFRTDEHFDYARSTHAAGYGSPPQRSVVHRRRVLFVKPQYWLVIDDLAASDDTEHVADSQFLVNAPDGSMDPDTKAFVSTPEGPNGARIAVVPLNAEALTARIAKGETEPEVRGFIPEGFEKLRPVPSPIYSTRFRKAATMVYAIVPFVGEVCPFRAMQPERNADSFSVTLLLDGAVRHKVELGPTRLALDADGRRFEAREERLVSGAS